MKIINTDNVDEEFRAEYQALLKKYDGNDSLIPKDERFIVTEKHRAMCVIRINEGVADPQVLSRYSIAGSVIRLLCGESAAGEAIARKQGSKDKRKIMTEWAEGNIGEVVTPQEVADAGGVSYATAIKFINENIGTFVKSGRGKYEIRDIKAERQAAKKA